MDFLPTLLSRLSSFDWSSINVWFIIRVLADVFIVWVALYYLISLMAKNTRTLQIFKGILTVVILKAVASIFGLNMVSWALNIVLNWGVIAVIVLLQPEIRSVLESLGQTRDLFDSPSLSVPEKEKIIDELYEACKLMSQSKTGAIICIERKDLLNQHLNHSVKINADITADLLRTIFMEGTMLHDGAVIIRGNKILSAAAFIRTSTKTELDTKYGARHRAALGISEVSDCITIVVSEETGNVTLAKEGEFTLIDMSNFKRTLLFEISDYLTDTSKGGN